MSSVSWRGGVAHDFNNQLTIIVGYADMLRSDPAIDERTKSAIDKIFMAATSSAELTAQLLLFARKGTFQMKNVSLHEIVAQVVSLLSRSVDKKISLTQHLCAQRSTINADEIQLQNAILNLCINARDAMPNGGELALETHEVEGSIELIVKDSGTGIAPEVRKKIFEPFYTTKAVGKGTGMGLAAVLGTVQSHGGTIEVESEIDEGTSFKLRFPLDNGQANQKQDTAIIERGSGTILIIDDDNSVGEVSEKMVQSLGYDVVRFVDPRTALQWYENNHQTTALVLLDMIMPELDGLESFKQLRTIDPTARVLICSGFSVELKADEVLELGAQGFIQKPFTAQYISQTIAKALRAKA